MVLTFDDVPMDPDDVTMAMIGAFYDACGQLSGKRGQENEDVSAEFELDKPGYSFAVGSDLWSEQQLQYSALKKIISTIFDLGRRFNMRQFTFTYYLVGQYLAVGHLKNSETPVPPREQALSGQTHWVTHGIVRYDDYGQLIDFELVALAVMHILEFGWNLMTRVHSSSDKIRSENSLFKYEIGSPQGLRFLIQGPPDDLWLQDILDIGFSIALFGRLFYMQELDCLMLFSNPQTHRHIYGSVHKITTLEANRSAAPATEKAIQ